jgi:hypothetical protein
MPWQTAHAVRILRKTRFSPWPSPPWHWVGANTAISAIIVLLQPCLPAGKGGLVTVWGTTSAPG